MEKSDFTAYVRYRAIEWLVWSSSLFLIFLGEAIVVSPDHGATNLFSAVFEAAVFVSFANAYVYGVFYYPVVSLLTFLVGKVVALARSRAVGRLFWTIVNIGLPLFFGMTMMLAIFGPRPVWHHLFALAAAVFANAFAMARED